MRKDSGKPLQAAVAAKKRKYTTPKLIRYGSVAKLTQSVGTRSGDGGAMMTCL